MIELANRILREKWRARRYSNRIVRAVWQAIKDAPGYWLAFRAKVLRQNVIFKDQFGHKYQLSPSDRVLLNWRRASILDSVGVVKYIISNVRQGDVCVDVGACYGAVSVPMWLNTGIGGKVLSIEADPAKVQVIKDNLALNGFPKDYVSSFAISDKNEMRRLRCYPDATGWNTFGNPEMGRNKDSYLIDVECVDFDTLLKRCSVNKANVVKIDVEGAELLVLEGMRSFIIAGQIRTVIFEVNPYMLSGMDMSVDSLLSFWDGCPYDLFLLCDDGSLQPIGCKRSAIRVWDCVAMLKCQDVL